MRASNSESFLPLFWLWLWKHFTPQSPWDFSGITVATLIGPNNASVSQGKRRFFFALKQKSWPGLDCKGILFQQRAQNTYCVVLQFQSAETQHHPYILEFFFLQCIQRCNLAGITFFVSGFRFRGLKVDRGSLQVWDFCMLKVKFFVIQAR